MEVENRGRDDILLVDSYFLCPNSTRYKTPSELNLSKKVLTADQRLSNRVPRHTCAVRGLQVCREEFPN